CLCSRDCGFADTPVPFSSSFAFGLPRLRPHPLFYLDLPWAFFGGHPIQCLRSRCLSDFHNKPGEGLISNVRATSAVDADSSFTAYLCPFCLSFLGSVDRQAGPPNPVRLDLSFFLDHRNGAVLAIFKFA